MSYWYEQCDTHVGPKICMFNQNTISCSSESPRIGHIGEVLKKSIMEITLNAHEHQTMLNVNR